MVGAIIVAAFAVGFAIWMTRTAVVQVVRTVSIPAEAMISPHDAEPPALDSFTPIGSFEQLDKTDHIRRRTRLHAFVSDDRTSYAVVYELQQASQQRPAHLDADEAKAEAWGSVDCHIDIVSSFGDGSVTTTNSEVALHDDDPEAPKHHLPGAEAGALWRAHRAAIADRTPDVLQPAQFAERFERAWKRDLAFQAKGGLYQLRGDRYHATRRLARRGAVRFWLPRFDHAGARWLIKLAIVPSSLAVAAFYGARFFEGYASAFLLLVVGLVAGIAMRGALGVRAFTWTFLLAAAFCFVADFGWIAAIACVVMMFIAHGQIHQRENIAARRRLRSET